MNIDSQLEGHLQLCYFQAKLEGYAMYTVEQLLYVLLDNTQVFQALKALNCSIGPLRETVKTFVETHTPKVSVDEQKEYEPEASLGFQEVIQSAVLHVKSCGREDQTVTALDVLVAMFDQTEGHAAHFLQESGVTRLDLVTYISNGGVHVESAKTLPIPDEDEPRESNDPAQALRRFAVNLNEKATAGGIDPLIGREAEIRRMIEVLCRRRKNNPLLVGDPGVGKTALAEGLALAIVEGKVPGVLKDRQVWALDMGALMAGTMMRGEFEKRVKAIVDAFAAMPEAILFIDEIHGIAGAGGQKGGEDAAMLLKPALADGRLPCIGATTYEDCRQFFEKDRALARRFQKIDVAEPTQQESVAILKGLKSRFEAHHDVRFTQEAIAAAVSLSARYLTDRRLPDKAVDVLDEAGSARRLAKQATKRPIGRAEIAAVVSRMARVPVDTVGTDDVEKLRCLERNLGAVVFGQDEAIEAVCSAIKLSRSGLGKTDRPVGAFLFAGPTGVGKTEVARQLALQLGLECLRFDMSEYAERHSVSRLIGAPPGYVGYEKGGELTERVVKQPHCVILLDELEKAHPDIFNILLQVMDHGTLTDSNGRSVDFTHTIVIMTTNAGAGELAKKSIGFAPTLQSGDPSAEIRRLFTPEFRNRLDAIVTFKSLDRSVIASIVDKFLGELKEQLAQKKVIAHFTEGLKRHLAEKGFDPTMGARPMQRLIQDTVRRQLADELLFGRLRQGGNVTIDVAEDKSVRLSFD